MRLAIVSRDAGLYSTRRLLQAAHEQGHEVCVLDPLRCSLQLAPDVLRIVHRGVELSPLDAVIARIGTSCTRHGSAVLRQFELLGVHVCNSPDSIVHARDKWRCLQTLAAQGLAVPHTVLAEHPDDTTALLDSLGPPPHVIKLNEGSKGTGVMLAESQAASRSMIESLRALHADFLVQRFIAEAAGADIRCLVIGGEVVAAMQRQARGDDFRSNLHCGGRASAVTLTSAEHEMALHAAQGIGLDVAGVDLLRSAQGPLLLEVNASPGLEGIEQVCRLDLAGRIVRHVVGAAAGQQKG